MPNIIDNEYLFKSLIEMVHDENNRIVSSGLASADDIKQLADSVSEGIIKNALSGEAAIALKDLIKLHKQLSRVKLPGDFVQISARLGDTFDVSINMSGEVKEDKAEIKEPELSDEDENKDFELIKIETLAKLEKIAYDLGSKGNHTAAFLVERHINEIKDMIK